MIPVTVILQDILLEYLFKKQIPASHIRALQNHRPGENLLFSPPCDAPVGQDRVPATVSATVLPS